MKLKLKLKDKLKKTGRKSKVAYLIALLVIIYFVMTLLKGLYIWTDGSEFTLGNNINNGISWVIGYTSFPPLDSLWLNIPFVPFEGGEMLNFYKVIVPPAIIFFICALFIADHRILRNKFFTLKAEIEKEVALRDIRKDAGIETVSESATVDVVISNATNKDPSWHDRWWGKITIGVGITMIAVALGLK